MFKLIPYLMSKWKIKDWKKTEKKTGKRIESKTSAANCIIMDRNDSIQKKEHSKTSFWEKSLNFKVFQTTENVKVIEVDWEQKGLELTFENAHDSLYISPVSAICMTLHCQV